MDFFKLIEMSNECKSRIGNMCKEFNLNYEKYFVLCKELSYQTCLARLEAIDTVYLLLRKGKSYEEIIKMYKLEL